MLRRTPGLRTAATLMLLFTGACAAAFADVPPRSAGGQALVVPDQHLGLGEVYHVAPGVGTQFTWTSDAPLMRVTATCNRVVGYLIAPFDIADGQTPLLAGALRIPVASLSTGSENYDQEFHGSQALNAAEHPEITFSITQVSQSKLISDEKGRNSYTLNVSGELKVKETTAELEVPMRLTLVPFTWQTMHISLGDFLILRAEFTVPVTDLGLPPPDPATQDFRSGSADFTLFLLCSTVSPEKNLDPSIDRENHLKQLRFLTLLRDLNDPEQAYQFGRDYMQAIWNNAPALTRLASAILTEEGIERRDLAFADNALQRANQLGGSKDPTTLNALARLHYERGDLTGALDLARQAVEHLEGTPPHVAAPIRADLQRYEAQAQPEKPAPDTQPH